MVLRMAISAFLSVTTMTIIETTILGVLLALNIEAVIGVIESILGFQFFPKDVFYISRFHAT
jgi:lipoprotein-releasing system permease protein